MPDETLLITVKAVLEIMPGEESLPSNTDVCRESPGQTLPRSRE
jgi:hypothetical protein